MKLQTSRLLWLLAIVLLFSQACRNAPPPPTEEVSRSVEAAEKQTPLDVYVNTPDDAFEYSIVDTVEGEGHTTYVVRMVSQRWLTEAEVKDPLWWHWLTIVVPDGVQSNKGLLFIGGGSRNSKQPEGPDEIILQTALASRTVVTNLHNVPNQPMEFVGDDYGPRVEDELIAYGWRQFLEGGATEADAKWLARLPMTKSAVRAMDVITDLSGKVLPQAVEEFVVAGGSKRGWTTWTTGAVDDRVVAIAPIVIDLLNVIPSFEHHWKVYGFWAPAVGNYVQEDIMEWQGSKEYKQLTEWTEPYSYRHRLDMPKLIINATGDQFFLPDSWRFYKDSLKGETHFRYVENGDHSLRETNAIESLISFYQSIVLDQPRPEFTWKVEDGQIVINIHPDNPPASVKLWSATNPDARDFRVETIGKVWESQDILLNNDGSYSLKLDSPSEGYTAFFGEITFPGAAGVPLRLSTGVLVTPDTYPHESYVSENPQGTKE